MSIVDSQEVTLAINAQIAGESGVSALVDKVEALARESGAAAPQFEALAQEIRQLGQQQVRIDGLQGAIESAKAAYAAVRDARHEVQVLDKALADAKGAGASREAIRLLGKELAGANRELNTAERAWTKQKTTLASARTAAAALGVDVKSLGTEQTRLATAVTAATRRIEDERAAAAAANPALKTLGTAASQATAALGRIGIRSADQIQAEINKINQDLIRLSGSAKASGSDFDRAWAAGQKRIAALNAEMNGTAGKLAQVGVASDQLGTKLKGVAAAVGGIFAVTRLPALAADLGRTADLYNNLRGRIDLVNSSQAGFNVTLDQTADLARATHTSLSETTNLMAALARAGEGVGTTQQDVLRLTETINKANQVAGQSAQAADAAVVQLIQGLQSGVLRGQEFNSIMEQSPRLARALADGLGVPLGALRALANEGKLTSDVVIKALQSQAQAIDTEFAKLPVTVGRAMTDLSTNWTQFLGELDQTTGASATAAKAISGVANNLDTVASAAKLVGEVAVAAMAVKAAGAVRAYAAQLVVATGATTTLGAATNAVAAAATRLAPLLRTMGWIQVALEIGSITSALFDLRAEYVKQNALAADVAEKQDLIRQKLADVSEQTGVTVTSMKELDAAVAAGAIHFDEASAKWVAGAEALGVLRERSQELVDQFTELTKKGKTVEEAFTALFKTFSADSFIGVQNLGKALTTLQADGTLSAQQVEQAWQQALSSLDAEQLVQFGNTARLVFQGSTGDAKELALALDAQLRTALKNLGIDASAALTGMSAKFIESANNVGVIARQFDDLKERGVNATSVLQQGLDKMLAAAATPTELESLKVLVTQLGEEGKLSGDKVTAALDKINAKADEATPGINSVTEAFKALGVVTDKSLKESAENARQAFDKIRASGTATAREIEAAFTAYAEKAVAANNGVVSETLKVEAAQSLLSVAADKSGKVTVESMTKAAEATAAVGEKAKESASELKDMGDTGAQAADDMVTAARKHNDSVSSFSVSWLKGADAASKYAREANDAVLALTKTAATANRSLDAVGRQIIGQQAAATAYVQAMEALDRRQSALAQGAAQGVEDMRMRLLELEGTEKEIAAARLARDKADINRQIALIQIEAERARIRQNTEEAARLKREIDLMNEQLILLDKIHRAEQRQQAKHGSAGNTAAGGSGSTSSGGVTRTVAPTPERTVQLNLNINGKGNVPVFAAPDNAEIILAQFEAAAMRSS